MIAIRWMVGVGGLVLANLGYADQKAECTQYASLAVKQFQTSQQWGCGYRGSRWNADQKGQYAWCLTVPKRIYQAETQARSKLLDQCQAKPTATPVAAPSPNSLNLPDACVVDNFTPIRQLHYAFRYEKEWFTPMQPKGVLQYDWNVDGKTDYGFIEVDQAQKAHATFCMSHATTWKRWGTDVVFPATGDAVGVRYNFQMHYKRLKLLAEYFAHNQGSCSTTVEYGYENSAFRVLDSKMFCIPAEPDYPISALPIPTLRAKP